MALADKLVKAHFLFWNQSNGDAGSINYASSLAFKWDCFALGAVGRNPSASCARWVCLKHSANTRAPGDRPAERHRQQRWLLRSPRASGGLGRHSCSKTAWAERASGDRTAASGSSGSNSPSSLVHDSREI